MLKNTYFGELKIPKKLGGKIFMDTKKVEVKDGFVLVEASKLSLADDFMQYEPRTSAEKRFKEQLSKIITDGIKDFYRPTLDPSFTEDFEGICYKSGKWPAIARSYIWWTRIAREFAPERKSRLGTKSEYIAFLGCLIKQLIKDGWGVTNAWHAVCTDSYELGHYRNSKDAKRNYEYVGSRDICGFCDLANTLKIVARDSDDAYGFWLASGCRRHKSYLNPIFSLGFCTFWDNEEDNTVGWVVLES